MITYGTTVATSVQNSWAGVLQTVRAQARKPYAGTLCFPQRIQYVHLRLLAKIWYLAQIFPPTKMHVQRTTVSTWSIWQGEVFTVPVTTLQRHKDQGCWALANTDAKCRTLLYARLWQLCAKEGSSATTLLHTWDLTGPIPNHPNAHGLPTTLPHFRQYDIDIAYTSPPGPHETMQKLNTASTGCC